MKVIYYDVVPLMALGTAKQVPTLKDLLEQADFVTLHVPEIAETKDMIGAEQLAQMKQGSYLINASRGSVVDIPALMLVYPDFLNFNAQVADNYDMKVNPCVLDIPRVQLLMFTQASQQPMVIISMMHSIPGVMI